MVVILATAIGQILSVRRMNRLGLNKLHTRVAATVELTSLGAIGEKVRDTFILVKVEAKVRIRLQHRRSAIARTVIVSNTATLEYTYLQWSKLEETRIGIVGFLPTMDNHVSV